MVFERRVPALGGVYRWYITQVTSPSFGRTMEESIPSLARLHTPVSSSPKPHFSCMPA